VIKVIAGGFLGATGVLSCVVEVFLSGDWMSPRNFRLSMKDKFCRVRVGVVSMSKPKRSFIVWPSSS
jgi:hypothetical protein